jgi:ParB/RepB/Spo0J family partition protein
VIHANPARTDSPTALILSDPRPGEELLQDDNLDELIRSINTIGLINPITVVPDGDHYQIVTGRRRLQAVRSLEWVIIPAIVWTNRDRTTQFTHEFAENTIRRNLTIWQEALYCDEAARHYPNARAFADAIGRTPAWVANRLDILDWPPDCQHALQTNQLSYSALQPLTHITDDTTRKYYLDEAIKNGCTARTTAAWAASANAAAAAHDTPPLVAQIPTQERPPSPTPPGIPCYMCQQSTHLRTVALLPMCPECVTRINAALAAPPDPNPGVGE